MVYELFPYVVYMLYGVCTYLLCVVLLHIIPVLWPRQRHITGTAPHVQLDYVMISNISRNMAMANDDLDWSLVVMPDCPVAVAESPYVHQRSSMDLVMT